MTSHDPQVSQLQRECERERQQSTRLAAQLREQQVRECMLHTCMLYMYLMKWLRNIFLTTEKNRQPPGIEPGASDLSCQCSTT